MLQFTPLNRRRLLALPRDEHHLAGPTRQWLISKPIVRFFDHKPGVETELGESRRCVQPNAVLPRAPTGRTLPRRFDGEHARQWIECSLVTDQGPVVGFPPIAGEKFRHHAVTAPAVPHERTARREHASEFADDARVVTGVGKKAGKRDHFEEEAETIELEPTLDIK